MVSQVQSPSDSNHDLSSYGDINSLKVEVGDDDECDDDDDQNTGGKRARKGEKCPYCNKSLPNAQRLTAHLTKFHDNVSIAATNAKHVTKHSVHWTYCGDIS